jgi:polyisoprenoid-binding protein YceI
MKLLFFSVLLIFLGSKSPWAFSRDEIFSLQKDHSSIEWEVTYLKNFPVRVVLPLQSGSLDWDKKTGHLKANIKNLYSGNEMRDHHLLKEDFFNAEKFPEINVELLPGLIRNGEKVSGQVRFFVKNKTKDVPFTALWKGPFQDPWKKESYGLKGEMTISLEEWRPLLGFRWNPDLVIEDQVKLFFSLQWQKTGELTTSSQHLIPADAKDRALVYDEQNKYAEKNNEKKVDQEITKTTVKESAIGETKESIQETKKAGLWTWLSFTVVFCIGLWGIFSAVYMFRWWRKQKGHNESTKEGHFIDLVLMLLILLYLWIASPLLPL